MSDATRVAIACQGGGSHAAFAAGVLLELLEPHNFRRIEVVGLSGTSGGAVCASLAWSGLVRPGGGPEAASAALKAFWSEIAAQDPLDAAVNFWAVSLARLPITWEVSPYTINAPAEPRLRELLLKHLVLPPPGARRKPPEIFVGATDIRMGGGLAFDGAALGVDQVIASAAVPPLFRAVTATDANGRQHLCWDGLFARNPPIREFTDLVPAPREIWVVRINPLESTREPVTMPEIVDRRNELAGNLALDQEIKLIEKINELRLESPTLGDRYRHIDIRQVELSLDLDYPSKLDRGIRHIERLIATGRKAAATFFLPQSKGKARVTELTGTARRGTT
ncbi:MAG: patatin-like phospholipase family protein [Amaricoccus sp.]